MDNTKEQIQALAEAHEQGIDTLATAIRDLYMTIDHLTTELRSADRTITALKHLLIRKEVVTSHEVEDLCVKISQLYTKKVTEKKATSSKPTAVGMQDELKLIHEAAKEASEMPYDPDAFIFGG